MKSCWYMHLIKLVSAVFKPRAANMRKPSETHVRSKLLPGRVLSASSLFWGRVVNQEELLLHCLFRR